MMPSVESRLVCAVDIGTSAVRASLVASDGRIVQSARRARPSGEGSTFFDADRLWDDVATVLRTLRMDRGSPRSLAVAGHVGAVAIDGEGRPVGRGIGWANTLGTDYLQAGTAHAKELLRIAGRPAATGGAVPFLHWLRQSDPRAHRQIRWVLSPKDDVIRRLSGVIVTDATSAAYTLASDVRRRTWSTDLITPSGVGAQCFPAQHAATDVVGNVDGAAAAATGLPEGLPIVAGAPDGTAGASAVIGEGRTDVVADVAGTTDVLTRVVSDPDHPATRGTVTNPYLVHDVWSCGGPTGLTGGATAYWFRLLSLEDPSEASEAARAAVEQVPPGCEGLSLSPLMTGSRFPEWRQLERGAVWGLTDTHTSAHFARAAQEAATYVVRAALEHLAVQRDGLSVVLAGGTARSDNLVQLRADVFGCPVLASSDPEVTLRGAAMLASVGAGFFAGLDEAFGVMASPLRQFAPDPHRAKAYDELFERWCVIRDMLAAS